MQNSIIWDENLSAMARFSLIAMLSLPDRWDYSVRGMAAMLKVSKDTMGKYLRELEAAGYLRRSQVQSGAGRFSATQYTLTDTPGDFGDEAGGEPCPKISDTEAPCPNLPDPEKPDPKKSPQKIRTEEKNGTEESPPYSPPTGDAPPKKSGRRPARTEPVYRPDWFVRFWALYPRRTARAAAVRAWDKLRPDLDLCRVMTAAIKAQMQTPQWREGPDHIPHPATWLNGARWLDEVAAAPPPDSTGWAPDPEVY